MSDPGKIVTFYVRDGSDYAYFSKWLKDVFVKSSMEGRVFEAALVPRPPRYARGAIDPGGRLRFFDEESEGGAHWRGILTASFSRANDAFFTAWDIEKAHGVYRGSFMDYPVKAIFE